MTLCCNRNLETTAERKMSANFHIRGDPYHESRCSTEPDEDRPRGHNQNELRHTHGSGAQSASMNCGVMQTGDQILFPPSQSLSSCKKTLSKIMFALSSQKVNHNAISTWGTVWSLVILHLYKEQTLDFNNLISVDSYLCHMVYCFSFHIFKTSSFFWKDILKSERVTETKTKREKDFYPLVHSPKCTQNPGLVQTEAGNKELHLVFHMGDRRWKSWAIVCYLLAHEQVAELEME